MNRLARGAFAAAVIVGVALPALARPERSTMARIPAGRTAPPSPAAEIAPFLLDRSLVSACAFAAFVRRHPTWRRGNVARVFAEPEYLKSWRTDLDPGAAACTRPVTFVSWFAARAYCDEQGKRLPTTDEWEQAATSGDPDFATKALAWYSRPSDHATRLQAAPPDRNGVTDLTGVVWEWTEDYSAEPPPEGVACGGGAAGAVDRTDYAAFMRRAFRSSLHGAFTLGTLGFRCAADDVVTK